MPTVKVQIDLGKFKRYSDTILRRIKQDSIGGMTDGIKKFGDELVVEVIKIYEQTASWEDEAIRKRIYKYGTDNPLAGVLAHQLDYSHVERSGDTWVLDVTNPDMYPLGKGHPYYALWQEGGSAGRPMTRYIMGEKLNAKGETVPIWHPGLPARNFILGGYVYAQNNAQKFIHNMLSDWVKEARRAAR